MIRTAAKLSLIWAGRVEQTLTRAFRSSPAVVPDLDPDHVRNLLIWSMDRLGDVVRATPAIRALAKHFHAAHVAVVAPARSAPVLQHSPWITELHQIDRHLGIRDHRQMLRRLKVRRWDLGVLMEADPYWTRLEDWWMRRLGIAQWVCFDFGAGVSRRALGVPLTPGDSWIDQFNHLAAAAGAPLDGGGTEIHLTSAERQWAADFLSGEGIGPDQPFALIHPGGTFLTVSRQWSPASFTELIDLMDRRWQLPIVVTGRGAAERATIDEIQRSTDVSLVDLCDRLDIRQLAAVIDRCAVCVMNDTGPLHVAQALRRPAVAILGPTAPEVVGIPDSTEIVRADLPCSPCAFHAGWQACSNPVRWECLSAVTTTDVLDAVVRQMEGTRRLEVVQDAASCQHPGPGDRA